MEYVGIDPHKKESQICLLTETGEVIERRIRTEPQRFAEVLGGRPRARIPSSRPRRRGNGWPPLCDAARRDDVYPAGRAAPRGRGGRSGLRGRARETGKWPISGIPR